MTAREAESPTDSAGKSTGGYPVVSDTRFSQPFSCSDFVIKSTPAMSE